MQSSDQQRVAIVTGAGAGLGKAHAKLLAANGFRVVVNDISRDADGRPNADEVADEIVSAGGNAVSSTDSIASWDGAHALARLAVDRFGRVDALVNNAGVLRDKTFLNMTREDIDLVLSVNLAGSIYATKAVWQHMIEQKHGRIVLTSSASGLASAYGQANYGAAKAGLVGFMNSLKNEGRKHDVFVNAICPLATTQMTENLLPPAIAGMSVPEHVSALVAWLCSDRSDANGRIFAVGAGHYAEIRTMKARGVILDPKHPATPDQVGENMGHIEDFVDPVPYEGVMDARTRSLMGLN